MCFPRIRKIYLTEDEMKNLDKYLNEILEEEEEVQKFEFKNFLILGIFVIVFLFLMCIIVKVLF